MSFECFSFFILYYISLNLNKDYFVDYSLTKGVLTGEVKKESAKNFFNVEALDCSTNPNVEIVLENKLLTSLCTRCCVLVCCLTIRKKLLCRCIIHKCLF